MRKSLALIMSLMISGCIVTPGEVVVRVDVCSGDTGSEAYSVKRSGRYWDGICSESFTLPVREQRAVWTLSSSEGSEADESISFAGIDGQPVNVDVGISYSLADTDEEIINMLTTYGPNLEKTIDSRVRDFVRDSLNACASGAVEGVTGMTVQEIYGEGKSKVFSCAEERVQNEFGPNGLVINRLTLNSNVRLPELIKAAIENAQAATQEADRVRREVARTQAESEKKIVSAQADADAMRIRAEAEANYNRTIAESLSPEVLRLRELEIESQRIQKWDGKLSGVVLGESSTQIRLK